jgi:hypothetical protein
MQTIRKKIKVAHDQHKSYIDVHHIDHGYEVGNKVFLRVKLHNI